MTDLATPLYDRPDFFAAYSDMREQDGRLSEVVEQPALRSMLPDIRGAFIMDLGCGAGALCLWLLKQGASSVTGVDASAKMLALAARHAPGPIYLQAEIGNLDLRPSSLDLVVSSLTLHYLADIAGLARQVARALRPSGSFVFSVEHPVVTCAAREWTTTPEGARLHWPVDRYGDEGGRTVRWLGLDDVPRQHRPVASYVEAVLDAGLTLRSLLEPMPSREAVALWPRLADQRRRPPFLLIRADKPTKSGLPHPRSFTK